MPPPKKFKRKLPTPDADGDGRTDKGKTICPFHHSSNGRGIKLDSVKSKQIVCCATVTLIILASA